jgi:RND family efflux transporter MFP subunit
VRLAGLLGVTVAAALAAVLVGGGGLPARGQPEAARPAEPPALRTVVPELAPALSELELPARTAPVEQALVYARATGTLAERRADLGDRVAAGQVLAVVAAPDVDRSVERARAAVAQARAQLVLATRNLERGQSLVERDFFAREELDERRARLDVARADLEVAEAELSRLLTIQGFQLVRAPFAGVVAERRVHRGDRVGGDQGPAEGYLFRLVRLDELRVEVDVPQSAALTLQPGMETEVRFSELPGERFAARVEGRSGVIDPRSGTMRVELRMANPDERLPAGMVAQALLRIPRARPALLVPDNAVVVRGGTPHVATVEPGGILRFNRVRIGQGRGDKVEVLEGLTDTSTVALSPNSLLRDGDPVRVLGPGAPAR